MNANTKNLDTTQAPKCKTLEHHRKYYNKNNPEYRDDVIDNYFWLQDRQNSEVIDYLTAENSYTNQIMGDTQRLQEELFLEFKSRIQETDTSAPWPHDQYYYYYRTVAEQEYSIFCRKLISDNNQEEILLDENLLAKDQDFFNIGSCEISPCHHHLAYTQDTVGNECYELYIKDLKNNKTYTTNIKNISLDIVWSTDSKTVLFIALDARQRPYKVQLLEFNSIKNNTPIIYDLFTEHDKRFVLSIDRTRTNKFLIIHSQSSISSEVYYLPASNLSQESHQEIKSIKPREQDTEYHVDHYFNKKLGQEYFYILINSKDKPNFELYRTAVKSSNAFSSWEKLLSHNSNITLEDIDCFQNFCILFTRENGLNHLNIINNYDFNNIIKYNISSELQEEVYTISSAHNENYDIDSYLFSYESFATPDSVYSLTIPNNSNDFVLNLVKQDQVLNNYNRNNYVSKRVFINIDNNTKLPISIIYNKNCYKKDGQHPVLLYGYGSYGISMDPYFSYSRLSLLDRGIAYAVAHIRGGGELGETWHHQGRLDCKKNTFNDFIKAAEFLIANKYTNSNKLIIQGGSAGGLLVGNVINQHPELFHAAIAEVPFVDCLNTMLDETLPLTIHEYEEWGNPSANTEVYNYMKSYTPYENIKSQNYPHLLINNSFEDCRVSYWEAAKWTAKLRAHKTDNNILLLKTEMTAGHGGASGRYQGLYDTAFNYSFILKCLNLT